MKSKLHVLSLIVAFAASTAFATHGIRMVGFNAKTIGRGGTTIGLFDSPVLMRANPAGISFLKASELSLNFSLMVPSLHFENSLNDVAGKTNYFPLPGLAYVDIVQERAFAWGVGVFTYGGMGADFTLKHDLFRDPKGEYIPQDYHSKFGILQGGPTVAYKITPEVSIGASAHLVFSQLEFWMPYSFSPSIMKGIIDPRTTMTFGDLFSAPPAQGGFGYREVTAYASMKELIGFGFQGKIGVAYKPSDDLSFGFTYASPATLKLKNGEASMDMTAQLNDGFAKAVQGYLMQNPAATLPQAQAAVMQQFAQLGIDFAKGTTATYDLENEMKMPQTIGIGGAYTATPKLRVAFDIEWMNWEKAFAKMKMTLSNGNNPNFNRILGNEGDFSLDFPMEWENSVSARIGGEYALKENLTARAGFAYGRNPVPARTLFPVFPAIVEKHVMLGASVHLSKAWVLDLAYEIALKERGKASSQSIIAREYDNSTSQLSQNIFHISLSWKFE